MTTTQDNDYANLQRTIAELQVQNERLSDLCEQALVQIAYLHDKFRETGSGNALIARLEAQLKASGVMISL